MQGAKRTQTGSSKQTSSLRGMLFLSSNLARLRRNLLTQGRSDLGSVFEGREKRRASANEVEPEVAQQLAAFEATVCLRGQPAKSEVAMLVPPSLGRVWSASRKNPESLPRHGCGMFGLKKTATPPISQCLCAKDLEDLGDMRPCLKRTPQNPRKPRASIACQSSFSDFCWSSFGQVTGETSCCCLS